MQSSKKPYLNTKIFSSLQENKIASALGWATVVASGARPCAPGDIISDKWLGECKTHADRVKSIFFSYDVWKKLKQEAIFSHRRPVLFTDDGSQSLANTWCVCLRSSLEDTNAYVFVPYKTYIKKNISFDNLVQSSELRSAKRTAPDMFKDAPVVFTANWGTDSVCLMPFDAFQKITGEQD